MKPSTESIRSQRQFPPQSLHDIIGHDVAVRQIVRRFEKGDHGTPVLIYGPEGVGKAALARMYAKALFCVGGRFDLSRCCDECESCRSFETQPPFGLIDFDAAKEIKRPIEVFAEKLQNLATIGRRVLIVRNVQRAPAQLVDVLLKRMESEDDKETSLREANVGTTFILLAEDLAGVRAAGQSRCMVQRLKPLDDRNARRFARTVLRSMDVALEREPFEALLAGCNGLPSLLATACRSIRVDGLLDTASIARSLKIDWGPKVIDYLIELLDANSVAIDSAGRSGLEAKHLMTGIRSVLSHLPLFFVEGQGQMPDDNRFMILPSHKMRHLAARWRKCAEAHRSTALQLWAAVSDVYLREVLDNAVAIERTAGNVRTMLANGTMHHEA